MRENTSVYLGCRAHLNAHVNGGLYLNQNKLNMETNLKQVHIGSRTYILAHELIYLKSEINYTLVHLQNGKKILSSTSLKKIEGRLKPFKNFLRINRGSIVNLDLIDMDEDLNVHVPNHTTITFSRRRKKLWQEQTLNSSKTND